MKKIVLVWLVALCGCASHKTITTEADKRDTTRTEVHQEEDTMSQEEWTEVSLEYTTRDSTQVRIELENGTLNPITCEITGIKYIWVDKRTATTKKADSVAGNRQSQGVRRTDSIASQVSESHEATSKEKQTRPAVWFWLGLGAFYIVLYLIVRAIGKRLNI